MRSLLVVAVAGVTSVMLFGSAWSQELPPAAPTDLIAGQEGWHNFVRLFWRDNANNEDSYRIERSEAGENGPRELVGSVSETCPLPGEHQCAYGDHGVVPETT